MGVRPETMLIEFKGLLYLSKKKITKIFEAGMCSQLVTPDQKRTQISVYNCHATERLIFYCNENL